MEDSKNQRLKLEESAIGVISYCVRLFNCPILFKPQRLVNFENCKSKKSQVKQSNCPISLDDSYDAIDYQVIMIDF